MTVQAILADAIVCAEEEGRAAEAAGLRAALAALGKRDAHADPAGLRALADNRLMPDTARLSITLGELRAALREG